MNQKDFYVENTESNSYYILLFIKETNYLVTLTVISLYYVT